MWQRLRLALTNKSKLRKPIQLIVFVTDRCNARCRHCFNWRVLNQGDDLDFSEMQRLSSELGGLLTLGISGGEPFLRSDLAAIYDLFSSGNGLGEIDIPTNGLLPQQVHAQVRQMLERDNSTLVAVTLSLDGLEETHDRIRGVPGSFAKLLETYQELIALKEEMPSHPFLIKVGTTLCNWNIRQTPELIEWVQSEMPAADFHNFEIMRGEPRDGEVGPPEVEDLEWAKTYIFEAWKDYAFYGRGHRFQSWLALGLKRFIFQLYIKMLAEEKQLIPCYAARTSAVVDAQGNIYFCELRESIGNLHGVSLRQVLQSERAGAVRSSIERGDCYCVHSCFQQKNVFLNPRLWPHIILFLLTRRFTLPPASHIRPRPSVLLPDDGEGATGEPREEVSP